MEHRGRCAQRNQGRAMRIVSFINYVGRDYGPLSTIYEPGRTIGNSEKLSAARKNYRRPGKTIGSPGKTIGNSGKNYRRPGKIIADPGKLSALRKNYQQPGKTIDDPEKLSATWKNY